MAKKAKTAAFDPKVFLATVNGGRSISKYRMNQKVFSQGTPADAVFYILKGKVKVTVVSQIFDLEIQEEAVIEHAAKDGIIIERRFDQSPASILGVRLPTVGKPPTATARAA